MAKKPYIGAEKEVPVYENITETVSIVGNNISNYFTVNNNSYYFQYSSGSNYFFTNHGETYSGEVKTKLVALQDMEVTFNYYAYISSEHNANGSFNINSNGEGNLYCYFNPEQETEDISGVCSGTLKKGEYITFSLYDSSTTDMASAKFSNFKITVVTDTIQIGTTIKSLSHQIKKAYMGVKDTSQRITMSYIGIGDKAIPCWHTEIKKNTSLALTTASNDISATTFNNKAIFRVDDRVDYFDENLTRRSLSYINLPKSQVVSTDNYMMFADEEHGAVYAYNDDFTRYTVESFFEPKSKFAATSIGKWVMFGSGKAVDGFGCVPYIDVYNEDTFEHRCLDLLSQERYSSAAASAGDYALIGGGILSHSEITDKGAGSLKVSQVINANSYATVDVYYKEDLSWIAGVSKLRSDVGELSAVGFGKHILLAGGCTWSGDKGTTSSIVTGYDCDSLERIDNIENLNKSLKNLSSVAIGNFALFNGGENGRHGYAASTIPYFAPFISTIPADSYSKWTLERVNVDGLSVPRASLAAATVGDFMLFAGGYYMYTNLNAYAYYNSDIVEIYQVI